jgi:predicted ATPase
MRVSRLKLKNWRNFQNVDIKLSDRMFIVGPNSCGKSNLLDVFRFLYDIVKTGGGLQMALEDRGGLKKIRCLSARVHPNVEIECTMVDKDVEWTYILELKREQRGTHRDLVEQEIV